MEGEFVIVLDTHAWLWSSFDSSQLSSAARAAIADTEMIGISAISLWEVALLEARGRIEFPCPLLTWFADAFSVPHIQLLPLTPEIAVATTKLDLPHNDPADRIVAATALVHGYPLVTADGKIRTSTMIETVW